MSLLTTAFQHVQEVLANVIIQEKEIKVIQIEKKERKLSLFVGDMIAYIENPAERFCKKLLKLTSDNGKVAGYEVNIQKLITFHNQQWTSEI